MSADRLSVQTARTLLDEFGVFESLKEYDPRWVGSIPLDIHNPGADADICCDAGANMARFRARLDWLAGHLPGATITPNTHAGEDSVIAKFSLGALPVEIYGRNRPVETHESYVHWLAEHRLLDMAEARFREDVRARKAGGLKTEPAFAALLGLGGEPYAEILKLASPPDAVLAEVLRRAGYALR